MDVLLVLDADQRHLLQPFHAARTQVAVQFVLEEATDLVGSVQLLHHHQRRVLRQGFRQQGRALLIRTDHLVRPPLMPDLVGGDIGDVVDLLLLAQVGDEAEAFRVGHGVGEGLSESLVGRELDDPGLTELIGAEGRAVVVQRRLHPGQHPRHVLLVTLVVIDGQFDGAVLLLGHLIVGGLDREEVQHRGLGDEASRAAAVFRHVRHLVARRDRRLIGHRGHGDVGVDPARADVVLVLGADVLQLGHAQLRRQAVLAALGPVGQQAVAAHADGQGELAVVDEGAVVDDPGRVAAVLEAALLQHRLEGDGALLARLHRRGEAIDAVLKLRPFLGQGRALNIQAGDLQTVVPAQVNLIQRRARLVLDDIAALGRQARLVRIEVQVQLDVGDLGLGRLFVLQ
ncbi:hypothetical protein D3C71_1304370 [compost metagenome]